MRPTLHFGGVYGDMEDYKISDVITMNPMKNTNTRKSKSKSKAQNPSKSTQYEQLKRFFDKNKDKYSDEDDINLFRKILLLKMLTYTACIDTYSYAII